MIGGRNALEHRDIPESSFLKVRKGHAAECAGHVAERVAADVTIGGGVGRFSDPDTVEDDDCRPMRHASPL